MPHVVTLCRVIVHSSDAPGLSSGISPGAPPYGFATDTSGWLPSKGTHICSVDDASKSETQGCIEQEISARRRMSSDVLLESSLSLD